MFLPVNSNPTPLDHVIRLYLAFQFLSNVLKSISRPSPFESKIKSSADFYFEDAPLMNYCYVIIRRLGENIL
jgi:hypothetical protein